MILRVFLFFFSHLLDFSSVTHHMYVSVLMCFSFDVSHRIVYALLSQLMHFLYLHLVANKLHSNVSCRTYATGTDAVAPNLSVRSASDDQLLSHSEGFSSMNGDFSSSSVRCDSDDIQTLMTESNDITANQQPTCNHDMPESCSLSCWTFANFADADRQRLIPDNDDGDGDKTLSCSPVTQPLPMTKSKSSDHCCLHSDNSDHLCSVNQSACFYPTSW